MTGVTQDRYSRRPEVGATVHLGLDGFARLWAANLIGTCYIPLSFVQLQRLLRDAAGDLADMLTGDGTQSEAMAAAEAAGRRIGSLLVSQNIAHADALDATLLVLGLLPDYLAADPEHGRAGPADLRERVEARLERMRAALAGAFAGASHDRVRFDQEMISRAMLLARREAERKLAASEARFRAVFTGAGLGIGIVEPGGALVDANAALLSMFGYPADELTGMPLADLAVGEDRAAVQLALDEPAEEYGADPIRVEKRFRRRDGEQLWANLTVTAIRDDQGALLYRIAMLEDVTDRQRLQRRLRYQALHDPLTSLPNRTLLLDRLAGAFEDAPPDARIGLCYLDLDGFKMINDSLGHEIGDQLLIVVAQRIQDCACGPGELVARMGGDEFVILVERTTGTDEVITIADHVLDALAEPVRIGMHELTVSTSIGIVERPVAQAGATDLMQAADITLYGAKAEGKARWTLYDPEASDRQIARFTLTSRLPSALERREFLLEYQPLVRLSDARVLGVEALVRWRHPELGLLGPDHFVPLAEETGLIVPLGRWVLRAACQQAVLWRQRHGADAPFVSVNLAVRQLRETKLVADVRDALDETGLPAEALQLELTESAVMGTHGRPFDSLEELAAMGVRLAIDDFGTGYSNLAYLKQLPVHEIKLAGSFLAGERAAPPARPAVGHRRNPSTGPYAGPDADTRVDDEIVTALVRMAHALRLGVTAEGIETAEQAARLRDLGCDLGQGWYFARPRPAEHVVFGALPGLLSHS